MKNVLVISTDGEELLANIEASGNSLVINGTDIPSSQWIGTGTYTTTVNGHQITITKASDNSDNLMLEKTADYTYTFTVLDTETEFNVSDQEKLDGIGTIAGAINGSTTISNVSVPAGQWTELGSFELPSGTWIVKVTLRWASKNNATGYRTLAISTSPNEDGLSVWNNSKEAPATTGYTYVHLITFLKPASSLTTYYVNAYNSDSSAHTCAVRWGAIKIA